MKSRVPAWPAFTAWRLTLLSFVLAAGVSQSRAAVINAASCSFTDVSRAVAQASPGDTVLLPAGTNGWPSLMSISGITLQGAGVNKTVIRDETPIVTSGAGNPFLQLNGRAGAVTRITQIQFMYGVTNNITAYNNDYGAEITVYSGTNGLRIDHCYFNLLSGKTIRMNEDSFGLIDHNTFATFDRIAVEVFGIGYGDVDWAAPTQYGSANAVFMEDNTFSDGNNFGWVDVSNGGRAVFRHNTCNGYYFNTHGAETTQRYRSARYSEVYFNNFSYEQGVQYQNFYAMCDIRGGSAVVFSNTANGYWSCCSLNYYRATDNDPGFLPWFGATGLRAWDANGAELLNGTATVTSSSLVVPGAGWTTNQWAGCTVYNYKSQLCGVVSGNDTQSMQFLGSRHTPFQITFTAGDTYTVHKVYPGIDQPGMGQCDLLSGDSPTPVSLHQAHEPVYIWGNQRTVNYNVSTPASGNGGTTYPNIQENRDFFNNIPRPNYSPYTYPHPLTLLTNAVATTNSVPPPLTNSVTSTNTLTPPTGLNVRPL